MTQHMALLQGVNGRTVALRPIPRLTSQSPHRWALRLLPVFPERA